MRALAAWMTGWTVLGPLLGLMGLWMAPDLPTWPNFFYVQGVVMCVIAAVSFLGIGVRLLAVPGERE